jgi:predicted ATPase
VGVCAVFSSELSDKVQNVMKLKQVLFRVVQSTPLSPNADEDTVVVYLTPDSWNDYGYVTSFHIKLWVIRDKSKYVDLGTVKILQHGQDGGSPELPKRFAELPEDYCSLGQSFAYYEMLHAMGESVWRPLLHGLRDVVLDPVLHGAFKDEKGFKNSLLRSSSAERALEDAPVLFVEATKKVEKIGTKLELTFRTSLGGSAISVPLTFDGKSEIPERWSVVIGYNGSGKTRLLANIGMAASSEKSLAAKPQFGYFEDSGYSFGCIIALSYSAFDTFELPRTSAQEDEQKLRRGYFYCGLRKRGTTKSMALKSIDELNTEFLTALERAKARSLRPRFAKAIKILLEEPSLSQYRVMNLLLNEDEEKCKEFFERLSTGHKLVLHVITQLIAYLQPRSLVVFDEPESHLHPSLLAAVLKAVRYLLDDTDSFCILATHSPVVIQETPRKHVIVLRRNGLQSIVEQLERETFGENVGVLTSDVFNLAASETDFHYVLTRLAKTHGIKSIEQKFGGPLGLQARSFLRSLREDEE